MSGGWEEGIKGFGLPRLKQEGAPVHSDDVERDLTDEQYAAQLKAYNDYHGIKEQE